MAASHTCSLIYDSGFVGLRTVLGAMVVSSLLVGCAEVPNDHIMDLLLGVVLRKSATGCTLELLAALAVVSCSCG